MYFVAMRNGRVVELVQVCYELTPDNLKRELNGLTQAMRYFHLNKATLVTFSDTDVIREADHEINVVAAHRYLAQPAHCTFDLLHSLPNDRCRKEKFRKNEAAVGNDWLIEILQGVPDSNKLG